MDTRVYSSIKYKELPKQNNIEGKSANINTQSVRLNKTDATIGSSNNLDPKLKA
jgi:hypothetical protein